MNDYYFNYIRSLLILFCTSSNLRVLIFCLAILVKVTVDVKHRTHKSLQICRKGRLENDKVSSTAQFSYSIYVSSTLALDLFGLMHLALKFTMDRSHEH